MSGFLTNFVQSVNQLDWKAIASLTVLGLILIIANGVTHYIKESISNRIRKRRHERDIIDAACEGVKRRADNLVARMVNLLIGWADPDEIAEKKKETGDTGTYTKRLESSSPADFSWIEVLAFRFLELFWTIQQFRIETKSLINNPEVDELEYFLVDKIPLAMRGKIYHLTFFTREEQEELGLFFHGEELSSVDGPTLRDLANVLKASPEKRRLFCNLVAYVALSEEGYHDICDGNHRTDDARHFGALAHLTIYLIDLFQRLGYSAKWEEYRIFLVKALRRVNELRDSDVYLYYRHDINQNSYLFTYPEDILESHWQCCWLTKLHLQPFTLKRKWGFFLALKARSRRFIYRHHKKRIGDTGVTIKADTNRYSIDILNGTEDTRRQLIAYLEGSGRRMPYRLREPQNQAANKAVDSTVTRVTPCAEQEPRHGQP